MFSLKFDRGFTPLRNPNPRFFEFETRLPRHGPAVTKMKDVDIFTEEFTDIFDNFDINEESKVEKLVDKKNEEKEMITQDSDGEEEVADVEDGKPENKSTNVFFSCTQQLKLKQKLMQLVLL